MSWVTVMTLRIAPFTALTISHLSLSSKSAHYNEPALSAAVRTNFADIYRLKHAFLEVNDLLEKRS